MLRAKWPRLWRQATRNRRGVVLVLVAVLMIVVIAIALFSIDVAYMMMVRTQLRAATDAAAKAATEALNRTQSGSQAVTAAIDVASKNRVAGNPLTLTSSDIILGNSTYGTNGAWTFSSGAINGRYSAVRISTQFGAGRSNGAVGLFFAGLFGGTTFQPTEAATATIVQQDLVLCLDRSHSMCFDLSGVAWSYPPGTPTNPDPVAYPPNATLSRWASLTRATTSFLDICQTSYPLPRVALVTWASPITKSSYEYSITKKTSPGVSNEVGFVTDYTSTRAAISAHTSALMMGGTDTSSGIDSAVAQLVALTDRPMSQKTIVLMTDGQWNTGRNPTLAATDAAAQGITIHVIILLTATQTTMEQVASITGGKCYYATNDTELTNAFIAVARSLPVVLTE